MSVESTREVVQAYFGEHDPSFLADDAVFTFMATGQEYTGREAVTQALDYLYHQAFDARSEERNTIYADGQAAVEADLVGRHIGEFAGIVATGREIRVPWCVVYTVEGGKIKRANIYLSEEAIRQQLGAVTLTT